MEKWPIRQNHGFIAGTLIHTDQGLVPIQEIKVGNSVLSRKNPTDPVQYQKVTSILTSEQKFPVMHPLWLSPIICTKSQLFWIDEQGWVPANKINDQQRLEFLIPMPYDRFDYGRYDFIYGNQSIENLKLNLWATPFEHIAIVPRTNDWTYRCTNQNVEWGYAFFDFSHQHIKQVLLDQNDDSELIYYDLDLFNPQDITTEDLQHYVLLYKNDPLIAQFIDIITPLPPHSSTQAFYTRTYQLEVENTHSYFVGKHGIWIHQ